MVRAQAHRAGSSRRARQKRRQASAGARTTSHSRRDPVNETCAQLYPTLDLTNVVTDENALQWHSFPALLFTGDQRKAIMRTPQARPAPGSIDPVGGLPPQRSLACSPNGWTLERSISTHRAWLRSTLGPALAAWLTLLALVAPTAAAREYLQVFVAEPYLELRTGPGRGYPVTQVVGRGESVDVLKRRTDWLKVRTERGVEGWASQREMVKTLLADGTSFRLDLGDRDGFRAHRWEMGLFAGEFGDATLISGYGSRSLNEHLKIDLAISHFIGGAADGKTLDLGLNHVLLPERRVSPFVMLGTGLIEFDPQGALVPRQDRREQTAYAGAGVRAHLWRRFFLRAEYKWHVVFTSQDDNEEIEEWKAGIAFFF